MKQNYLILFLVLLCLGASAQVRRIGVLGSSTANGQGVPADSGWTQRIQSYYRLNGLADTLQRIAASTFDCYSGMPTGYVPPAGRNQPNQSYNITRLMSRNPVPTTVIINYPTTNFEVFSDAEILFCLDSIRKYANSLGAAVYVATTQPRDNFDDAGRARLKYLNGVIKNYFGDSAIDFFTTLNNPVNNRIRSEYALGDGIHVNSRGQEALYRAVLSRNIFGIDTARVQRTMIDFGPATGPSASPDFRGRYWNNVFEGTRGIRLTNAVTTGNIAGTIGLEVINPLGATAADNPAVGLSGTVGIVGDYPSSATNDHTLALPSFTNGKWRIYGLDPLKTYTIRFWGSMLLTGYRILQVKRSDETVWQEFNAGMSKSYNTAVIFAFSGKTEMSFDFRVKSGSVAGHINVVDIVSTVMSAPIPVNQPPVMSAGPDISITAIDSAKPASNATDPDGQIESLLWRKISGPASFVFSSTTIANPVISGLTPGIYQFEFSATDNRGAPVKDTITITVIAPQAGVSQRILVDLGLASSLTNSPDQWGKYWNNVADARRGVQLINAKTIANEATTVRFEVINPAGAGAAHDLNTRTSNSVGIVGDYPASATTDNALAHNSITNGQWKISGLAAGSKYNFKFWGSIPQPGTRIIQMKLAGDTSWKEYNSSQNYSFVNAINFQVAGVSEALFDIRVKQGSTYGYINVVDITIENKIKVLPVADAGMNTTITLPTDSIRLSGSNLNDPENAVTRFLWRKISGPSKFAISDSTVYNPTLRNLVAGIYGIELKTSDTFQASSVDTIYITVSPAKVNIAPIAVAGPDTTITLPVDFIGLNGTGSSDADGSIAGYAWSKISGPASFTIATPGSASTSVSNLGAGVYGFRLTVTDNLGKTDSDTIYVTAVTAAPGKSERILIDAGLANLSTTSADSWGKYWNNVTDARSGISIVNAVNTANASTGISMQVVNAAGSSAAYDLNTRTSNTVGVVGDYPASATNDNAFVNNSVTNGQWRFTGLQAGASYNFKFWGSIATTNGNRVVQIKRNDETAWQEYNSTNNLNFNTAAVFNFTGKTEVTFDIRVKSGSSFGYINVIDITTTSFPLTGVTPSTATVLFKDLSNVKNDQSVQLADIGFRMIAAPNPAMQKTTLMVQGKARGRGIITITNDVGHVVSQAAFQKTNDIYIKDIFTNSFKPGIYFIKLRIAKITQTISIVKH